MRRQHTHHRLLSVHNRQDGKAYVDHLSRYVCTDFAILCAIVLISAQPCKNLESRDHAFVYGARECGDIMQYSIDSVANHCLIIFLGFDMDI